MKKYFLFKPKDIDRFLEQNYIIYCEVYIIHRFLLGV